MCRGDFSLSRSKGHLTQDFVLEVPPELIIGLPARVMLNTIDRSELNIALSHDTSLFFMLVIGCIETKFCNQIRILLHFS